MDTYNIKNWGASLGFRDFRFLWASTVLYSMGTGMEQVSVGWLIFELTDSPFMVGVGAAARMRRFIPSECIIHGGGFCVDTYNIKNWGASLGFRDFRFLWASTVLYSMGTGMEQVSVGWLIFELTDSPFMVGVGAAARMLPFFLLGVLSGVIADRWDRRMLLGRNAGSFRHSAGDVPPAVGRTRQRLVPHRPGGRLRQPDGLYLTIRQTLTRIHRRRELG